MTGDVSTGNHNRSLKLTIRLSTSQRFEIGDASSSSSSPRSVITPSSTIRQVKEIIAAREESGHCPVARQRLIYKGRILSEEGRTLADYGVGSGAAGDQGIVLYLVKGSAPAAGAAAGGTTSGNANGITTGNTTRNTTGNTSGTAASYNVNNNNNANSSNQNPLGNTNNIMNMMNMFGNSNDNNPMPMMPSMESFQQQLQSNPQMMSEMLNNPMVQNLLSQPDFLRTMMENNPQMRQILNSNPELRHALEDPEFMRRSMQMMRDPTAMQNMMRNQDLAMSQIENMPGGYAALRRMYEDVQAPMLDAMSGGGSGGDSGSGSGGNDGAARGSGGDGTDGASNRAMPNPWGAPSTSTTSNNRGGPASNNNPAMASNPFASFMGGMGMPNLGNPAGGASTNPWADPAAVGDNAANLEATIQMLENPMMNQMMQQFMSNPEMVRQMMEANPMMRQLRETNPQMAAMLSNPEMMRSMMDPNNLRAMLQMQRSMQQLSGSFPGMIPPTTPGSSGAGTASTAPAGGLDFSSLLGGSGTAASSSSNPASSGPGTFNPFFPFAMPPPGVGRSASSTPGSGNPSSSHPAPGQRFRVQLQSLQDMGFTDRAANIRALTTGHGNLNRAIEILLENPPEMGGDSSGDIGGAVTGGSDGDGNVDVTNAAVSGSNNEGGIDGDGGGSEPKGSVEKKND
ncbi:hypothetical protein ACHAXS_010479 [Conticribra weissflogii]